MKTTLTLLLALLLAPLATLNAAAAPPLAAVRAADDERVAAILAAAPSRLAAIFSDELRYAHSTGVVDTKASYIESLTSGRTRYHLLDYSERSFTFPAPGIALMTGRAHVKATSGGTEMDSILSFLAVWREEKGQWRFLAWQSCKLPAPTPSPK